MSLTDKLNRGHPLPFQDYKGPVPKTVPALSLDNRTFAGGKIVLCERLATLTPNNQGKTDQERIDYWGRYFSLADLCTTFEELVKLQTDSGFLTGIRGIVEKDRRIYVAVAVDAVKAAIKKGKEKYFNKQFSALETAHYQTIDGVAQQAQVQDVFLFPYNGIFIAFNSDQFDAIDTEAMKRENIINGRDMKPTEIVRENKVIHPAWGIYPAKTIVPLIEKQKQFTFEGGDYNFDSLMGFYLPSILSGNLAEGRALYVGRLDGLSRLFGDVDLGGVLDYVVGVDKKYA